MDTDTASSAPRPFAGIGWGQSPRSTAYALAQAAPTVDEAAFDSDEDRFGPQDADLPEAADSTAEILSDAAPQQLLDLLADPNPKIAHAAALELAYRSGIPVLAPIDPADLERHGRTARYLAQPLANYAARLAEHRTDLGHYAERTGKRTGGFNRCTCGHTARNANGRGIHQAAAEKRADKIYLEEVAAIRKLLGR
jgi:hypothetical protein